MSSDYRPDRLLTSSTNWAENLRLILRAMAV
jgi:hypothetical protein